MPYPPRPGNLRGDPPGDALRVTAPDGQQIDVVVPDIQPGMHFEVSYLPAPAAAG